MATESAKYLSTLHKQIDQYFSFAEVRTLCFDLGIDYDNIPGNAKSPFIRNLIVSLARQNRLPELLVLLREQRPHVPWQNVPPDFSLPESVANEDIRQVVQYTVYGNVVHGDQISVGDISGSSGVAIGREASATVTNTPPAPSDDDVNQAANTPQIDTSATAVSRQIQEAIDRLNKYLQLIPTEKLMTANELTASVKIIMDVATADSSEKLHLKLLTLGQEQLAADLEEDVPGISKTVARFSTAVAASIT